MSRAAGEQSLGVPQDRLEGLMLFRVVLVTLFLGSALLLNVSALGFSTVRSITIVSLIVGTYALTIFYALMLRQQASLEELGAMQITCDVITIGALVHAYGGIDSPFLFLFLLTVIAAALAINRQAALYTAGAVTLLLILLASQRIGLFDAEPAPGVVWKDTLFRVALNGSAAVIVALLAGYLTERLGEAATQIRQQEKSLFELRALNDKILASLSSGLLTVDPDNTIIFFNAAAETICGVEASDAMGSKLADVVPALEEAVSGDGQSPRGEALIHRGEGDPVFVGFSTSPLVLSEDAAPGRIVIFQDLSAIKELEAEVRRSERLAAIGRLSAAIAHEIRNPLASISGSVEMLSTGAELPDDDRALLQIVLREVDRLNTLVSDFLEYSRPRTPKLASTQLAPIIHRVVDLFRYQIEDELRVDLEIDDDLPDLELDEQAVEQMLWNLLNNAREAARESADPVVSVLSTRVGNDVIMSVQDSGSGIADEDLERVFQPFFTTKTGGTGLGLATLYRIAEAHGASVVARSSEALGGAQFDVRFPGTS